MRFPWRSQWGWTSGHSPMLAAGVCHITGVEPRGRKPEVEGRTHYSDITWLLYCLFNNLVWQTTTKSSELHITRSGDRWIPLTKGQSCGKRCHVMTSFWHNNNIVIISCVKWKYFHALFAVYMHNIKLLLMTSCGTEGLLIICFAWIRYSNVIMSARASQNTGVLIVCSTVSSGADQRKH